MGAGGDMAVMSGAECAANPPPGISGGIPIPEGGAIADVVGDRFGPVLELRNGVGRMTPQDAEAALRPP